MVKNSMEKENFILKTELIIKELLIMELLRVKEDIYSIMDVYMKVNLKKIKLMVKVHTQINFKDINITVNGNLMFQTVTVKRNSSMVHTMKGSFMKE